MKGQKIGLKVLVMLLIISMFAPVSSAQVVWVDGGLIGDVLLSGTHEYQELCFITGEPVLLKGTVELPVVPTDKLTYTLNYSFELSNVAKGITLERELTYNVTKTVNENIDQTSYVKKLTAYDETITTAGGVYTLGKYTFADSRLEDNTPAVDYISGNILAERTYYLDGDYLTNSGHVTYQIVTKPVVGYSHLYGSSETLVVQQIINSYKPNPSYDPNVYNSQEFNVWSGTVDIGMSSTKTVKYDYQYTDPQSISFRGNYFKITSEENVLTYKYSLPKVNNGTVDTTSTKNVTGERNLSKNVMLETKALITPKIRDIGGYWAEDEIFLLTSMEIFDVDREYFVPTATISRLDFGKAIVVATHGVLPTPTKTEIVKRQRPGVDTPFLDIMKDDPDYHYIEFIKANDIMVGKNGYFKPNEVLTRAEAIAILIKALGLQYVAPAAPYNTSFVDDKDIQPWAKDFIYMANEIGLASGTSQGYIYPNRPVTKAEAAILINNFINHLKDQITYDYREKILNR